MPPLPQLPAGEYQDPNTFELPGSVNVPGQCFVKVFLKAHPSFCRRAAEDPEVEDARERASAFDRNFSTALSAYAQDVAGAEQEYGKLCCYTLCTLRDRMLREQGFDDCYAKVKSEENTKALQLLPQLLQELDSIRDVHTRLATALRGVFAGNIFDLGAASTESMYHAGEMPAFNKTRQQLLPRPWIVDDLDRAVTKLGSRAHTKAIMFVDNAGADVVLGMIPFARELLKLGVHVVLAANTLASINDITNAELRTLLADMDDTTVKECYADGRLRCVASGSTTCVIDLAYLSEECVAAAQGADLVVLEGMGRAIETNLNTRFTCDSLKLGMVKHPEVAALLGGRLYDVVCKFETAL